jgi:putative ATP-binding cassette transporter
MDEAEPSAERIEVVEGGDDRIVMENLEVAFAGACAVMAPSLVEIRRGDRVLIVGVPGCGKSMLFRAIAGLWPWGRGRLEIPSRADMILLPQRPYIPVVPLRAALTYPAAPETVEEGAAVAALTKAGLRHLAGSLDRTLRWDQDLTLDEQQRLGLARVLVKRPAWVVGDEAFDIMHKDLRQIVRSIFEDELAQTGLVSISRHEPADGFYTQVLHLSRKPMAPAARPIQSSPPLLLESPR